MRAHRIKCRRTGHCNPQHFSLLSWFVCIVSYAFRCLGRSRLGRPLLFHVLHFSCVNQMVLTVLWWRCACGQLNYHNFGFAVIACRTRFVTLSHLIGDMKILCDPEFAFQNLHFSIIHFFLQSNKSIWCNRFGDSAWDLNAATLVCPKWHDGKARATKCQLISNKFLKQFSWRKDKKSNTVLFVRLFVRTA